MTDVRGSGNIVQDVEKREHVRLGAFQNEGLA